MIRKITYTIILMSFIFTTPDLTAQVKNPRNIEFNWKTDTSKHIAELSEFTVALPRGAFPKIDFPKFIGKEKGLKEFYDQEPVISVEMGGDAKAYSLNMLSIHEISNDTLNGVPILVTYCPLCNSGIIFDRRLTFEGKDWLLDFEVSGMLRNSDMVMFDPQTESWWQQLMGQAMVGDLAGAELEILPSLIISVEEFFERYPNGKILSKENGDQESQAYYGTNYYAKYDSIGNSPWGKYFDMDLLDNRLPAMERIVDIESEKGHKIYPFSAISEKGVINDSFGSKNIVLFFKAGTVSILDEKEIDKSKDIGSVTVFNSELDGQVLNFVKKGEEFFDSETDSKWDLTGRCVAGSLKGKHLEIATHSQHFAFAWLAFHPGSVIYGE